MRVCGETGTAATAGRWSTARRWALGLTALLGALTGCDKAVCEGVEGSCLALRVDGDEHYDRLEGILTTASGTVLKTGEAASDVTLPVAVQILPPPAPFSTAQAGALRVNAYRGTDLMAAGMVTLSWPDGARIDVKLALIAVPAATPTDMSTRTDLGRNM